MWDRCIEWNGNLELLKSLRKLNENLGRYLRAVSWNVVSNHFPGAKGGWGNWRAMPTFWLLPTLNNVSHFMFSIIHTSQSFKYMYIHPHNTRHNWQYMFNLTWAMLYLSYLIPTPGHRITWGCWCRICASLQRAVANLGLCTWDTGPSKHNGFLAAFCCRFFSRWMRLKGLEGEVIQVIYVCIYNLFIYIYMIWFYLICWWMFVHASLYGVVLFHEAENHKHFRTQQSWMDGLEGAECAQKWHFVVLGWWCSLFWPSLAIFFQMFVLFHRQASCVLLINVNASADGRRWLVAGSLGDLYLLPGFELPSLKINSKSPWTSMVGR